MGVCYFYGRGVPEDKSKAVEIWKSILEEVVEKKITSNIRYVALSMNVIIMGWELQKTKKNLEKCYYLYPEILDPEIHCVIAKT